MAALSVVLCTHNRHHLAAQAITSLIEQDFDDFEIVVVDSSTDKSGAESLASSCAAHPRVRYSRSAAEGLSKSRNLGVALSKGEFVAFIDDDAIASTHWTREILRGFQMHLGTGVVGGRVNARWPTSRPDWLPEHRLSLLSVIDLGPAMRTLTEKEWLAGCNIAFRKADLLEAGGFSESLGRIGSQILLSNEETTVLRAIRASGKKIVYNPAALVEHMIDPDRLDEGWLSRRVAWQAVSDFISDPRRVEDYADVAAAHVSRYLARNRKSDDIDARLSMVYDMVVVNLTGKTSSAFGKVALRIPRTRFFRNIKRAFRRAIGRPQSG